MMDPFFFEYALYNVPNYALALLIYLLLGRLVLSLFVPADWDNYIYRSFCRLTNPVLTAVRFITPSAISPLFHLPIAVFWLMSLRVAFTLFMLEMGLAPLVN